MVGDEINLITFRVDNIEYQVEEGMTWGEFVNSEYNTGSFYIHDRGYIIYDYTYVIDDGDSSSYITSSDIIENIDYIKCIDSSIIEPV